MQVFEEVDDGSCVAPGLPEPVQGGEELAQAGLGVDLGGGSVGVADAEEVPQQGQGLLQDRVEGPDRLRHLGPGGGRVVAVGDAEQGPQEIEHRQERSGLGVGQGVGGEHLDSAGPAPFGELVGEAALAHARAGHDPHQLTFSLARPGEGRFERRHLLLPAHERREAPGGGHLQRRPETPRADKLEHLQGVGRSLDCHRTEGPHLEVAAHQCGGGGCQPIDPGSANDSIRWARLTTLPTAVYSTARSAPTGPATTSPEFNPIRTVEGDSEIPLEFGPETGQLLAEVERPRAGAPGVVLLSDGRPEKGHDPVTGELVDPTPEPVDPVAQEGEEPLHQFAPTSASMPPARSMDPTTSANRTVTCLRSPSGVDDGAGGEALWGSNEVPQPWQNLWSGGLFAPQAGQATALDRP